MVRSNLTTMSDMMSQLDPVTVKQADMELLEVKTELWRDTLMERKCFLFFFSSSSRSNKACVTLN